MRLIAVRLRRDDDIIIYVYEIVNVPVCLNKRETDIFLSIVSVYDPCCPLIVTFNRRYSERDLEMFGTV